MANWAAIGALGTAAQGAGNYFGQVNAQKVKDERLAQARGEFIADRDHQDKRADQKVIDDREFQANQKVIDAETTRDLRASNKQLDHDFGVANPTDVGSPIKGKDGNFYQKDSNGDLRDLGVDWDPGEGVPQELKIAQKMRKDIQDVDKRIGYSEAKLGYNKLVWASKQENAISDHGMVFYTMKALDPGSTVREGEFKSLQEAREWFADYGAQPGNEGWSLPAPIASMLQKSQGKGVLLPEQRKQMVELAANGFRAIEDDFKNRMSPFEAQINAHRIPRDQTGIDSFDIGSSWIEDEPAPDAKPSFNSLEEFLAWEAANQGGTP
jgi:hypothetical protein